MKNLRKKVVICLLLFIGFSFFLHCPILAAVDFHQLPALTDEEFQQEIKIYGLDESELALILPELQKRFPDKADRLKAIAEMYLGAEYFSQPFVDELAKPLSYRRTNCTMFVIYATTFLNSSSYQEALTTVKNVHYRDGIVGYQTRYHFTTDRISDPNNPYFSAVTEKYVADQSILWQVSLNLNVKDTGGYLLTKLHNWSQPMTIQYIKRSNFSVDKLKALPRTLGVAFVKRSNWPLGVVVGHEGILIDGDLYHSGSVATGLHKIEDYFREVFPKSPWEGVIFFHINQVQ